MKYLKENILNKDKLKSLIPKSETIKGGLKAMAAPLKNLGKNVKEAFAGSDPKDDMSDLIFIYPRVFYMTFPSKEKIKELAGWLNDQFKKTGYYIWNLSEHTYDTNYFNNQVAEYTFVGYPCPPLQHIFVIVKSIIEWLNGDKNNVAIIHCQGTKGRSALVIACLLSALKVVNHPMEALTYFCNKLHLNDTNFLFPSQHLYIKHFANLMDDMHLNRKTFILESITISEVPQIMEDIVGPNGTIVESRASKEPFKPYVQIFKGDKPIYNYLTNYSNKPQEYAGKEHVIKFDVGVEVSEDILIRCRHFKNNEDRVSIFRIMLHPAFLFNEENKCLKNLILKRDIDFSPNVETSAEFNVILKLKQTEIDENNDIVILEKAKQECQELAAIYQKNKKGEPSPKKSPKKSAALSEEEQKNKFDIDEETPEENKPIENEEKKTEEKPEENPEIPAEKSEKIEKLLNSIQGETKVEAQEEDIDDYIKNLEKGEG